MVRARTSAPPHSTPHAHTTLPAIANALCMHLRVRSLSLSLSPLLAWDVGAASVLLTPPVNGTTDYVLPVDEFDATSPGTCVPAFDQGAIPIGNGNSEVHTHTRTQAQRETQTQAHECTHRER
jgi:hypothetical protein